MNYELCFSKIHFTSTWSLLFGMLTGSSRIRLILRARISAIHRQTARHFKLPPAVPSKIDASTPTEGSRRFVRSIPIGPSTLQRPLTLVGTPLSRRSPIRRDTCPATTASTTSLYSVAVNRGRSIGSPAIDTWPDHHPRTTVDYPVPRRRDTLSLPPNVCWRQHHLHRPPRQRLVSVRLAFPEWKAKNDIDFLPTNIYILDFIFRLLIWSFQTFTSVLNVSLNSEFLIFCSAKYWHHKYLLL